MFPLIISDPYYVTDQTLHFDLNVNTAIESAIKSYSRYYKSLSDHPNILAKDLSKPMSGNNPPKVLKRKWCHDQI